MINAIISDELINEILSELGIFEDITIDDLEISKDTLITRCINPSLREYYRWNPIKLIEQYSLSTSLEIDFPNDFVFTVLNSNLNTSNLQNRLNGFKNPFFDRNLITMSSSGKFGTVNDYNLIRAKRFTNITNQSIINDQRNFRIDVDRYNRKVKAYTNVNGELTITWGVWNNIADNIPFSDLDDFINLSKSKVLRMIGLLRGQLEQLGYDEFNYQLFLDRADVLEEEVMTKFKEKTKMTIISS